MTAYATSAEYATYAGTAFVTATATATVALGKVTALAIGAGGGFGYLTSPTVVIAAPTTGVRATAQATVTNGVVSLLELLDGGSGYGATAPAVTIASPVDLARLLGRASEVIEEATMTAWYPHDDDGLPTDADTLAAFRDATCAQVEFWLAGDEEDDVLGPLSDLTIGNVKAAQKPLTIAPRAARIMRNCLLYRSEPRVL